MTPEELDDFERYQPEDFTDEDFDALNGMGLRVNTGWSGFDRREKRS